MSILRLISRRGLACLLSAALCQGAMANNVQVTLEGSLVTIFGDNAANSILISQSAAGDFVVTGRTGTTVNGVLSVRFPRLQLNAAEIRMEGGNDFVTLRGVVTGNDLFIDLGAGADRLTTSGPVTVGANLTIEGSAGNDTVQLTGMTVVEDMAINGGQDALRAVLQGINAGKSLAVIGDSANDTISVTDSTVTEVLSIEATSEAAISYERRAKLRVTTKKLKSAELDYSAAINLSPQNVAYYVDRALVREQLHDLKGAREDLDQALELAPDSNRIALIRARLHQLLGETEAVRDDMKRAMTSEPKTVEDWISRALAQLPRFPDRALRDLRAAEALAPNSADVLQNLAYVHSEHLKDMPAAVAALDRILDADANNEMARGGRCVLLARLGKDAEAFQDIESLSQLGERAMPATLFQMGCAHALLSPRHSESQATAIKYIAKALKRNYGAELLDTDSDLAPIRELPDFAALKTASKIVLENTQP